MAKATNPSTQLRIAKEIVSDERIHNSFGDNHSFIVFSHVRDRWEARCQGSFDSWLRQAIFDGKADILDGFRGQARHGRGFDDNPDRQIVRLYIW